MRLIYIVFAAGLALLAACGNGSNESTNPGEAPASTIARPPAESKLNTEGTQKLMDMMAKYYALKNALVATKAADVTGAASTLAAAAENMLSDSVNSAAVKPYLDTVITQCKMIAATDDKKCEQQRIHFEHVSSAMFGMLKAAEVKHAGTYRQYCPMAFNNKGAYWLSEEEEIKNPYFGKKMLECGEVTDSL